MITFNNTVKFLVGDNAIDKIAYEMMYFNCSRALIIMDSGHGAAYISAFKKYIKSSDIYYDIIEVGDGNLISDTDKVIDKFYEASSNAIIVLGGKSATDIGKAVKYAVSHNAKTFQFAGKLKCGVTNIPLIIVPTGLGCKNCASKKTLLYGYDNERMIYDSEYMLANAVVLDKRMTRSASTSDLVISGAYSLLLALCANIESVSPFARGYALSAIELVRDFGYFCDGSVNKRERSFAILCANAYAGVAFDESNDAFLAIMALHVSEFANVGYKMAFNSLAPHYLDMYMNKSNTINNEWLVSFLGLEKAVKIETDKRNHYLVTKVIDIINNCRTAYNVKFRLSDYGVTAEDLIKIYEHVVKSKDIVEEEDSRHNVLELLNRAL